MVGIFRNTLCHVGTARYAANNSAKYLQSMTLTNSCINNSLPLFKTNYSNSNESKKLYNTQAEKKSTNFGTTIRAAVKKISIFADEEVKISNIGPYKVSLKSGKVGLITPKFFFGRKNLILPATFSTELNGEPIEPKSNKISAKNEKSLKLGKWNISLDGGQLTLQVKDSGETFILKHSVYAKALEKSPEISSDGGVEQNLPELDSDIIMLSATITSKTKQSGEQPRSYPPDIIPILVEDLQHYGYEVPEYKKKWLRKEITDTPDSHGRMKLRFPMTVTLDGAQQIAKIKDTDNTLTFYHTVDIETKNVLAENLKNKIADEKINNKPKIGSLLIELESGNLVIEPKDPNGQSLLVRQEVNIKIDFNGEVPSILLHPTIKRLSYI